MRRLPLRALGPVLGLLLVVTIALVWWSVYLSHPRATTLDQRVAEVASQLRCPVCQGESVQDSPSELAQQMRAVIRQQLQEGRSEQQVIQYFVDRYGERILWNPPRQGFSLLVWLIPPAVLLGGAVFIFFVLREWRQRRAAASRSAPALAPTESTPDEELERYRAELEAELAADDPLFLPSPAQRGF
ncbi:cytochrome c-type biogenesis protein [Thermogemmatispora carboxidivorans]|uniref:cytochrome c-type biogenesis protein n=1 Tax=Thermogemmatispora carboxidivorans TaxID=1382306 RepID=UPI00069BE306|nr:cytochrome c-type biogenesis protein [Thermogemmatispora carboxidivorans]